MINGGLKRFIAFTCTSIMNVLSLEKNERLLVGLRSEDAFCVVKPQYIFVLSVYRFQAHP
jgi:hypothetical protein